MKILLQLFWSFFKVTISSFGGGYVLLPLLQGELVRRREWISDKDLVNYYALGQCTPGIISMNVAMFTGYKIAGRLGSLVCALAVSIPCIFFAGLVMLALKDYLSNPYVENALNGIKIFMAALIFHTIIDLFKKSVTGKRGAAIFLLSCIMIYPLDLNIAFVIIISAFLGCFFHTQKFVEWRKK